MGEPYGTLLFPTESLSDTESVWNHATLYHLRFQACSFFCPAWPNSFAYRAYSRSPQLGKNCRSLALPLRLHTRSFARCHRAFLVTPWQGEGLAGDHCDSTVKSCWLLPDLYHQEWKEFEAAGGATGFEVSDHRTHWPLCVLCLHWFEHKITHDNHDMPRWIFSQAGIQLKSDTITILYLFFIWWSLVVRLCLSFIFT